MEKCSRLRVLEGVAILQRVVRVNLIVKVFFYYFLLNHCMYCDMKIYRNPVYLVIVCLLQKVNYMRAETISILLNTLSMQYLE